MTNDEAGRAGSTGSAQADWLDTRDRHMRGKSEHSGRTPVSPLFPNGPDTRNLKTRREDQLKKKMGYMGKEAVTGPKKQFTVGSYHKVDGESLGDPAVFTMNAVKVADEIVKIVASKQKDYGPNNIQASPFGAVKGLTIRLYDKVARLANLSETAKKPEHESLRDTFVDIAGYGIIGLMLLDGTFPKEK